MVRIVLDLVIIYCFALFIGAGPYELLVPDFFRQRYLYLLLAPGLGLLQLAITDAYLIFFSVPLTFSLYVSALVGVVTLILALRKRAGPDSSATSYLEAVSSLARERANALRGLLQPKALVFLAVLGVILFPVLRANMPTTPYRIGIDQVGYGETAQYLVEGGTLHKITATLLQSLNTTDLRKAEAQNLKALNFNTYVDSEFLLKAFRWGFPGALASLTILTGSGHVFRIEFLLLILSYALTLGLVFNILRECLALPPGISFILMVALAFNCNLLNIYYEGQLAQVFVAPYFLMILLLFHYARRWPPRADLRGLVRSSSFTRSVLLLAALITGMFSAYNEGILLLAGSIGLMVLLDLVLRRSTNRTAIVCAFCGFVGGFFAMLPITSRWIVYSIANLQGLSHAGFWQPHWGSLAEIIGLLDMYTQTGYKFVGRSPENETISITLSIFAVFALTFLLLQKKRVDRSFWLAPFIIIAVAYIKMHLHDQILNYPYMKIYTMFTPLVFCAIFAGLHRMFEKTEPAFVRYGQHAAIFAVVITGLLYINQYVHQDSYVTSDMFALYQYSDTRQFDDLTLLTPRNDIADFMLVPLISMNWINESYGGKYLVPYLASPVKIIMNDRTFSCRPCFVRRFKDKIDFQNESYILYNTGHTLKDLCTKEAKKYTLDALGYRSGEEWSGLPSPQCQYTFGQNLPYQWSS